MIAYQVLMSLLLGYGFYNQVKTLRASWSTNMSPFVFACFLLSAAICLTLLVWTFFLPLCKFRWSFSKSSVPLGPAPRPPS